MTAFLQRAAGAPPHVKICGLTRADEAEAVCDLGAEAIGLNFWPRSKRFLRADENASWIKGLAGRVCRVGVFVNAEPEEARRLLEEGFIDLAQFHGDETPEYCAQFTEWGLPFLKAFAVRDAASLHAAIASFATESILLDAYCPGEYGGSGKQFDWALAREVVQTYPEKHVLLSGGLHPGNIAEAVAQTHPAAVDAASGVESAPGRKDLEKVRAFLEGARSPD